MSTVQSLKKQVKLLKDPLQDNIAVGLCPGSCSCPTGSTCQCNTWLQRIHLWRQSYGEKMFTVDYMNKHESDSAFCNLFSSFIKCRNLGQVTSTVWTLSHGRGQKCAYVTVTKGNPIS